MKRTMLFGTVVATLALIALWGWARRPVAAYQLNHNPLLQTAIGSTFTYQGFLTQNGNVVNGADQCDGQFSLWDAANGGNSLGSLQIVNAIDFTAGYFTVAINGGGEFGSNVFNGTPRWLEIAMRCPAGNGSFTTLGRTALTAAPYALYSDSTGALQGNAVSANMPTGGQVLGWDGTQWVPVPAATGPTGPQGPAGPAGQQGPAGSAGISGWEIVRGATVTSDGAYTATADCPVGKKVLGGGGSQGQFGWYLDDSKPKADGSGWEVEYAPDKDGAPTPGIGEAWAICANVQ